MCSSGIYSYSVLSYKIANSAKTNPETIYVAIRQSFALANAPNKSIKLPKLAAVLMMALISYHSPVAKAPAPPLVVVAVAVLAAHPQQAGGCSLLCCSPALLINYKTLN